MTQGNLSQGRVARKEGEGEWGKFRCWRSEFGCRYQQLLSSPKGRNNAAGQEKRRAKLRDREGKDPFFRTAGLKISPLPLQSEGWVKVYEI